VYLNEHPKYKPIVKISKVGCRIKHISNHAADILTRLERSKRESCFHLEGRNYFWQHGRALKLHAISSTSIWLVVIPTPLKKILVRQMGFSYSSQYMGKESIHVPVTADQLWL